MRPPLLLAAMAALCGLVIIFTVASWRATADVAAVDLAKAFGSGSGIPAVQPQRPRPGRRAPVPSVYVVPKTSRRFFRGVIGPDVALGPVITTAGPRAGLPCNPCTFVAVTTCCKSWGFTQIFLSQLLEVDSDIHLVVFDDVSVDGGAEATLAMGVPVIQPTNRTGVGLTELMNLAWRYYYARPELSTMMIVNNDLEISPVGTIAKLNRCMANTKPGAAVVCPMSNPLGLGTGTHNAAYLNWQNSEHPRMRPEYGNQSIPAALIDGLPGSIVQYNQWLDGALAHRNGNSSIEVLTTMGFWMVFRKDHPLRNATLNKFMGGSRNLHQEHYLFEERKDISAYVCQDVFVFHNKSATGSPLTREAMEKNKLLRDK